MQYDNNFALMTGEGLTILEPGQAAERYRFRPGQPLEFLGDASDAQERRARLFALWGTVAYERGWHRLPAADATGKGS